jgi:hypothetical protein
LSKDQVLAVADTILRTLKAAQLLIGCPKPASNVDFDPRHPRQLHEKSAMS